MKFKITYRVDQEEYFCLDYYIVEADTLPEAATSAYNELEETLKATLWSVERIAPLDLDDAKDCGCSGFFEVFGVHRPGCLRHFDKY